MPQIGGDGRRWEEMGGDGRRWEANGSSDDVNESVGEEVMERRWPSGEAGGRGSGALICIRVANNMNRRIKG